MGPQLKLVNPTISESDNRSPAGPCEKKFFNDLPDLKRRVSQIVSSRQTKEQRNTRSVYNFELWGGTDG